MFISRYTSPCLIFRMGSFWTLQLIRLKQLSPRSYTSQLCQIFLGNWGITRSRMGMIWWLLRYLWAKWWGLCPPPHNMKLQLDPATGTLSVSGIQFPLNFQKLVLILGLFDLSIVNFVIRENAACLFVCKQETISPSWQKAVLDWELTQWFPSILLQAGPIKTEHCNTGYTETFKLPCLSDTQRGLCLGLIFLFVTKTCTWPSSCIWAVWMG